MKRRRVICIAVSLALAGIASVTSAGVINCHTGTNALAIDPTPQRAMPGYLTWFVEPTYGGEAVRIADVSGMALSTSIPGSEWGSDARHHFAKDQPWSADGALLAIENKGGTPPWLYLDGSTYKLTGVTSTPGITYADWRWHPTLPDVQIVVDDVAGRLYWTNVRTHAVPWLFLFARKLPAFSHSDGIGSFEGNPSDDGRFIALSDAAATSGSGQPVHVLIVKMNTRPPVSAVSTLPDPGLLHHSSKIGWISVTPDARELVVKYAADSTSESGQNDECIRVFDIDTDSTSLTYLRVVGAHAFGGTEEPSPPIDSDPRSRGPRVHVPRRSVDPPPYIGCGRATGGLDSTGVPLDPKAGWVYPLKHADMMMDGATPILVGVNGCGGIGDESDRLGRILRVDLHTGAVSRLSPKDRAAGKGPAKDMPAFYRKEPPAMHVSCRNSARPGWAYVTYARSPGKRFSDEIVAIKVDSSGAVERFAHTHSDPDSFQIAGRDTTRLHFTDAEPQAVPSRDGGRVIWTSNWSRDCSGDCGPRMEFKDYVLDATCGIHKVNDDSPVAAAGASPAVATPSLASLPNPFVGSTTIQFELQTGSMVRLELFDAQGRRVALVANGFFPAGRHALSWDHRGASGEIIRPGVYLCRLTAGAVHDQTQMVLLQ